MGYFDPSGIPKVSFDADYVVEWYVENNLDRYKKLSVVGAPTKKEVKYDARTGKRLPDKDVPTHAVVYVVLEIPFHKLESVTNTLRGKNVRAKAPALLTMAQNIEEAVTHRDRMAALEREVHALQLLTIAKAAMVDARDVAIERAANLGDDEGLWSRTGVQYPGRKLLGIKHQEQAKREINAIAVSEGIYSSQVKAALDEKRLEVAAGLLCAMPDDE